MNHQDVNLSRIFSSLSSNVRLVGVFPAVMFMIQFFVSWFILFLIYEIILTIKW